MFCEGILNRALKELGDIKCQVLGISHKKNNQCMIMNHLKKEIIKFSDNSSVKLTINILMIFQSIIQKSKKYIYLRLTANTFPIIKKFSRKWAIRM
jgi:ABC-type molybdate transport system ATPase subunit